MSDLTVLLYGQEVGMLKVSDRRNFTFAGVANPSYAPKKRCYRALFIRSADSLKEAWACLRKKTGMSLQDYLKSCKDTRIGAVGGT